MNISNVLYIAVQPVDVAVNLEPGVEGVTINGLEVHVHAWGAPWYRRVKLAWRVAKFIIFKGDLRVN